MPKGKGDRQKKGGRQKENSSRDLSKERRSQYSRNENDRSSNNVAKAVRTYTVVCACTPVFFEQVHIAPVKAIHMWSGRYRHRHMPASVVPVANAFFLVSPAIYRTAAIVFFLVSSLNSRASKKPLLKSLIVEFGPSSVGRFSDVWQ